MRLREEIINKISEIFQNCTLGEFENVKNSFFEALTKSINQMNDLNGDKVIINKKGPNEKITSKMLRKLCHNFYKANKDLVNTRHTQMGSKKPYALMKYDVDVCKMFGRSPLPGRPELEGKILYQELCKAGLEAICIMDVEVKEKAEEKASAMPKIVVKYSVINKEGYKVIFADEAQDLLKNGKIAFLVAHNKQYVPLLRRDLQQQIRIEPDVAATAASPVAESRVGSLPAASAAARTAFHHRRPLASVSLFNTSTTDAFRVVTNAAVSSPIANSATITPPVAADETASSSSVTSAFQSVTRSGVVSPFFEATAYPDPIAASETVSPFSSAATIINAASAVQQSKLKRQGVEKHSFTVERLNGEIVCRMKCDSSNNKRRSIMNAFKRFSAENKDLFFLTTCDAHGFIELRLNEDKKKELTEKECLSLVKAYYEKIQAVCIFHRRACPPVEEIFVDKNDLLELQKITFPPPPLGIEPKRKKESKKRKRDDSIEEVEIIEEGSDRKSVLVEAPKERKPTPSSKHSQFYKPTDDDSMEEKDDSFTDEDVFSDENDSWDEGYLKTAKKHKPNLYHADDSDEDYEPPRHREQKSYRL